jgi:hypothetical protein
LGCIFYTTISFKHSPKALVENETTTIENAWRNFLSVLGWHLIFVNIFLLENTRDLMPTL